jgi:hypothetical protein
MRRLIGVVMVGLMSVSVASAHFPFIVPDGKGDTAKVIFSDDLNPDTNVNIEKLANTKLTLRDSGGKDTPLDWKKGEGFYSVSVPGSGNRIVYGVTEYGVLQKGEGKPFKLTYCPKAILGAAGAKEATIGDKLPLEVVALVNGSKVRFQAVAGGKPVPELEATIIMPDGTKKATKLDKEGLTPEVEGKGRVAVIAKWIQEKSGEHAGKKYDEVRLYATLVCDIGN